MQSILFLIPPIMSYDRYVNPGFNERLVKKGDRTFGNPVTDMPLGLISMSAYLKKHEEVKIKLIDFNILMSKRSHFEYDSYSKFFGEVLADSFRIDGKPDFVGISALFTTAYYNMIDLAERVREMVPTACITAGGGVPTNLYERIFKDCDAFDALCFGEGEIPFLELVRARDITAVLESRASWITPQKVKQGDRFAYEFITDLDEIPFYDYSILDYKAYAFNPTLTNTSSFSVQSSPFHFATSRGCPHKCCFCASHSVHGRKMRYYSVQRVREDLTRLKNEYGARIIGFQDDHLTAKRARTYEIIQILKKLDLKPYFQNGLTMKTLDREMLETMKAAGVTELTLPIESGSDRVLKEIMHKPLDLSIVDRVVKDCRELGIDTYINILIGLPGETKRDMDDALVFLKTLDVTWFRVVVAAPLVGSEMLNICLENNYLTGDYIGCDFKHAVVSTEEFTAEFIEQKAYEMNLELNFVENSDFRLKNYEKALAGFENVIRVSVDHAFGYYFAAKCCDALGDTKKYRAYAERYAAIVAADEFWKKKSARFGVPEFA